MMSDTQMERDSNKEVVERARGNVLIAGLGLGLVLKPILAKSSVETVLVIEKHKDVIALVAPAFKDDEKLTIMREDIYTWEPPARHFDTIYFDIWPNISTDNLKGIHRLHRRFKPALRAKGWMESWMREDLEEGWF